MEELNPIKDAAMSVWEMLSSGSAATWIIPIIALALAVTFLSKIFSRAVRVGAGIASTLLGLFLLAHLAATLL